MLWFNVPKILFGLLKKFYRAGPKYSEIELQHNKVSHSWIFSLDWTEFRTNSKERGGKPNERKKEEPINPLVARVPINKTMFMSIQKYIL